MDIKLKENIWKSDKSFLGFYCVNIFECSEMNTNLERLLKYKILKEIDFGPIKTMRENIEEPTNYYGSFLLDKICSTDFKALDFDGLKAEIREYWKNEDWGNDLPIFKTNFELALSNLKEFDLKNRKYFYLNAEKLDSNKLINPIIYAYLICIISTKPESNKIITLTFGLD